MYRKLNEMHKAGQVSFANVVTFNMDEYVGIPRNHPHSYHTFMFSNLFRKKFVSHHHQQSSSSAPLLAHHQQQSNSRRLGPIRRLIRIKHKHWKSSTHHHRPLPPPPPAAQTAEGPRRSSTSNSSSGCGGSKFHLPELKVGRAQQQQSADESHGKMLFFRCYYTLKFIYTINTDKNNDEAALHHPACGSNINCINCIPTDSKHQLQHPMTSQQCFRTMLLQLTFDEDSCRGRCIGNSDMIFCGDNTHNSPTQQRFVLRVQCFALSSFGSQIGSTSISNSALYVARLSERQLSNSFSVSKWNKFF
ncbi:hypothetical protein niasHT_013658 [Heterodera trifolii]|uniref:Uncharacterized protein n=1 Tax=Heterodera trifolii TaxID=157864 RepID=A0ABD2LGL3_9BILA